MPPAGARPVDFGVGRIDLEAEHSEKRIKMSRKRIGTHSGSFHCDEALACYMLTQLEEYADAEIVRTRDPAVIAQLDIVVDVGAVYDPSTFRFDHHQRGFAETLDADHKIKLSSAGLIYKHFGKRVIQRMLGCSAEEADLVYRKVYDHFIEEVDAIDNGVSLHPEGVEPPYKINSHLSARVAALNPDWHETDPRPDDRFRLAMAMCGDDLRRVVTYYGRSWLPAYAHVRRAVAGRLDVDPSGRICVLDTFCPWADHLFSVERELGAAPILYVVFVDTAGDWRVRAVPASPGSFECRRPLPEPWRGLRNEALEAACGVPGAVFVHAAGFIGGHRTREGALAMARKAAEA